MQGLVQQYFPSVELDLWHRCLLCCLRFTYIETPCYVRLVHLSYLVGHEQVPLRVTRLGMLECLIWASERLVVHLKTLLKIVPPLYPCLFIAFPWCKRTNIYRRGLHGPGSWSSHLTVSCRYQKLLRVEGGEGTGCLGTVNTTHVNTGRVAHDPRSISTAHLSFSDTLHALLEQSLFLIIS